MNEFTIVQIITFLTVVMGFLIQLYREDRNRRWDHEDRKRIAEETAAKLAETAEKLERSTEKTAHELKAATQVVTTELTEKINVGTEHAVGAYNAANNVNVKIEALNQRLIEQATTVAALTKTTVEDLKDSTKEEAAAMLDAAKHQMEENTAELSEKIDKSTKHAEAAYKEANAVNLKLERIGLERAEIDKAKKPEH